MPYIDPKDRATLQLGRTPENAGELNYLISSLFNEYITKHGLSYQILNDCMGAAQGASNELYRRQAVSYENHKLTINGDVYGQSEKV